jgi:hypothetical protein
MKSGGWQHGYEGTTARVKSPAIYTTSALQGFEVIETYQWIQTALQREEMLNTMPVTVNETQAVTLFQKKAEKRNLKVQVFM